MRFGKQFDGPVILYCVEIVEQILARVGGFEVGKHSGVPGVVDIKRLKEIGVWV